ncbi:MAG: DEAD/DEAH box helicase [Flavobacteriales bacterium]|jgi:ATP-dependent RNA helicase DeaD|nr:DEAD/DEAH box helicase [Flavobacteriales bacterium]MBT5089670.1 DEAD/DEAH box helicase [Flavobacteriales bacterium]
MENFKTLGVKADFIKGLNDLGIISPTEIQQQVIPLLLDGNTDLVGQAQTGTGKTAAFGLPLLDKIDPKKDYVQGLILCPTRELGQQVAKQLFRYTKYSYKIFTESVYGGEKIDKQIANLKRTTHIVVATPGRLIDLVNRKAVDLSKVKTVILDEADEMLSMGFKKELDEILSFLPEAQSKWLFSATMPQGIKQIVNEHLSTSAHRITGIGINVVNSKIEHKFVHCEDTEKFHVLLQFLNSVKEQRGIVFCRTRNTAKKVASQLIAKNVAADAIHGDLLQKERDKVMRAFKNEKLSIIVATDIAARGIDVADLTFVVHFQLPDQDEYYTHRSGRTARAGKEGVSLVLANGYDIRMIRKYERNLKIYFSQIKSVK